MVVVIDRNGNDSQSNQSNGVERIRTDIGIGILNGGANHYGKSPSSSDDTERIVARIKQLSATYGEASKPTTAAIAGASFREPIDTSICIREANINQDVTSAIVRMVRTNRSKRLPPWLRLECYHCTGDLVPLVISVISLEGFSQIAFQGPQTPTLVALGTSLQIYAKSTTLTTLVLEAQFDDDSTAALAQGLAAAQFLRELNLNSSLFSGNNVATLAQIGFCQNSSLQKLSLQQCRLQDHQGAEVIQNLAAHPSLQCINISYNQCASETIQALTALLKSETSVLETLICEHQGRKKDDTDGNSNWRIDISPLIKALLDNSTLRELDVSGNDVTDEACSKFADVLLQNKTLQSLHLWDNRITDVGATAFAEAIPQMDGLKRLYLNENPISDAGVQAVVHALAKNSKVQHVGFPRSTWIRGKTEQK